MSNSYDLIIQNANVAVTNPTTGTIKIERIDVGIKKGRIEGLSDRLGQNAEKIINAKGLHLLPGAIDTQVHFREPGFPEKEDLASGTRSAIYGGVTTVFEMPNTDPPTLTSIDVADKLARAKGRAWCNYSFYVGASPANLNVIGDVEKMNGTCGVKMFLGSSTGNLVVGTYENAEKVLRATTRRVAIHSEDDTRLKERKHIAEESGDVRTHPVWRDVESAVHSTNEILKIARKLNRKVHILHVTSAEEMTLLRKNRDIASVEVTPQHLTLHAPDCYDRLGTFAQMNPPIRDERHKKALWDAVLDGTVDVLGSDHAPHTKAEKALPYPRSPSGMTGVQTLLPMMLNHVTQKTHPNFTLERLVELTARNPARLFGIVNKGEIRAGYDADLVLVDLNAKRTITNSWIQSRCGWSPFDGYPVQGWVVATLLNGHVVYRDDQIVGHPQGQPLNFVSM